MTGEGMSEGPGVSKRSPPRVLLVGYNGANNTGSEARLLSIIEDVRAVLGPETPITIPTLNQENLCRYIDEGPNLRIAPIPSIYWGALKRLVKGHDLVLLVEGSCYMDTWTSALLWAFLWATRVAAREGKPCMAYAVDSGNLSTSNLKRVIKHASKTDLIVLRTQQAAERMRKYGVTAPMEVTADTAFTFELDPAHEGALERSWPEATNGVIGFAMVDFYSWPVVIRPWGRAENRYKWPYYFSRSSERREATKRLAEGFAREAERIVERYDKHIALFCMEELDGPLAEMVRGMVSCPERLRVFSSCDHNASEMLGLLSGIELLVSSRYHGCVMTMSEGIPPVAVGHDPRVEDLFREMGLFESNFISYKSPDLFEWLRNVVDSLMEDPSQVRTAVLDAHREHLQRARRNRELLRTFVLDRGWSVVG
jgi:polysaccharide pyruvyl transferase WcaK-like protein